MKWPDPGMNRTVVIQHDGASAHIAENDQEFSLHAKQGVWNICLETQPVKSPDKNVLDLSFFSPPGKCSSGVWDQQRQQQ